VTEGVGGICLIPKEKTFKIIHCVLILFLKNIAGKLLEFPFSYILL